MKLVKLRYYRYTRHTLMSVEMLFSVVECEFYAALIMSDVQTHALYGAPETVWIHYVVTANDQELGSGKDATVIISLNS
jgi:hypothetical protein